MIRCQAVTAARYYGDISTEDRKLHAVAHLALARSQKSGAGILGYIRKNWAVFITALFVCKKMEYIIWQIQIGLIT